MPIHLIHSLHRCIFLLILHTIVLYQPILVQVVELYVLLLQLLNRHRWNCDNRSDSENTGTISWKLTLTMWFVIEFLFCLIALPSSLYEFEEKEFRGPLQYVLVQVA